MSTTETKQKEETKNCISIASLKFGLHKDTINPIMTLIFPESEDRGFEFRTSSFSFIFRLNKHDYYNFIDTLFSEIVDEFQASESYNPLIDDFKDYLIAKMNGEV